MALEAASLSDINFDGSLFTWTNNRVWQRLDSVVVTSEWNMAYSLVHLSHLGRDCSDHAPLLIKSSNSNAGKGAFQFLNV